MHDRGYSDKIVSRRSRYALQTPDTARIVVVATSDLHGQAVVWDFGRRAGPGPWHAPPCIDSRIAILQVPRDAGDARGQPFAAYYGGVEPQDPRPIVDAMNQVGYDAPPWGTTILISESAP
jgi:2',3'-cyclic-nucleotide 2'-phosphodiesterase (5'-nucleotidase family)